MNKFYKIALVSILTLAMALSATLAFAVTYPYVSSKTAATYKAVNINKTTNLAGYSAITVKTGSLSTAYFKLYNLVPVVNTVKALGGTAAINETTKVATFNYDGSTTTLTLNNKKGGNAYKFGTVWYVDASKLAPKLVTNYTAGTIAVKYESATKSLTRSKIALIGLQWKGSIHDSSTWDAELAGEAAKTGCARCHNGFVFSNYAFLANGSDSVVVSGEALVVQKAFSGYATDSTVIISGAGAVEYNYTCTVCHYSDRGKTALTTGTTPMLLNKKIVKGVGSGALCMACHEGRNKTPNYASPSTSVAPHHSGQTDLLFGYAASGYRYPGEDYEVKSVGSPHAATPDACVGCHMSADALTTGVANHTMDVNGAVACGICHFGSKSADRVAFGDYDGDNTIESYTEEVEGLTQVVRTAIQDKVQTDLATDSTITVTSASGKLRVYANDTTDITWDSGLGSDGLKIYRAGYNVLTVEYDGSNGLHNPVYAVRLLQSAYKDLTTNDVPNAQIR